MYTHLLNKYRNKLPGCRLTVLRNTLLMVCLLLDEKTLNLWKLKGAVGKVLGNNKTDSRSHYQRLKRWLWSASVSKRTWIGMLQASVSLLQHKSRYLLLDGTSWKYAGKKYHFLTLSILYQAVSIPIWWRDLSKLGISNQWERKLVLKLACKLFDLKDKVLLADREYMGREWFGSLHKSIAGFVIRLRNKAYQEQIEFTGKRISKLENKAKGNLNRLVWKKFELAGFSYYYVLKAYRSSSGKIAYVRLSSTLTPARAAAAYGHRYRIESMFKHLKSNGFNLESLHVKQAYKVNMMMAALVLAYTLSVVEGLKKYKRCIRLKKHGLPEMSVFRFGLDLMQNYVRNFALFINKLGMYFDQWLKKQICPVSLNVP